MGAARGLSASSAVLHLKAWRARRAGQIAGAACGAAQALQGAQVCTSGESVLASSALSAASLLEGPDAFAGAECHSSYSLGQERDFNGGVRP